MTSKRHQRKRSCGHKIRYREQNKAIAAKIALRQKTGEILHPYRCRWCGNWHLGHR